MNAQDCATCRDVAAELALGIAVGDERAAALQHLSGCEACRRELDRFTATLDTLLTATPSIEPPAGFGDRAVAAFATPAPAPTPTPRRHRSRVVLAAAAVVVAVASLGLVILLGDAQRPGNGETAAPASSDVQLDGRLTTPDGTGVGTVTVTSAAAGGPGGTTELVVTLASAAPEGTYRVECDYESGRPYTAGELRADGDGPQRWSASVSVPTYDLRRVRLVSTTGGPNLEADMAT